MPNNEKANGFQPAVPWKQQTGNQPSGRVHRSVIVPGTTEFKQSRSEISLFGAG